MESKNIHCYYYHDITCSDDGEFAQAKILLCTLAGEEMYVKSKL